MDRSSLSVYSSMSVLAGVTVQGGEPRDCGFLATVETPVRPAPAMPEAAVFQPSRDCERALSQPFNWRKGRHCTTLLRSVV